MSGPTFKQPLRDLADTCADDNAVRAAGDPPALHGVMEEGHGRTRLVGHAHARAAV